ncbi:MAG: hypothetical protein LBU47_00200 [Christensenellaceae bacterium]|nr:hypothetical protein [Christensenellaceae bacterium]
MQNQAQSSQKLDTKALSILKEQMEQEAVAYSKYDAYARQFLDQNLSSHAGTLAAHHKQHFDSLFNYLSSHN